MDIVEIYESLKGKEIPCFVRDKDGFLKEGVGTVCGYQQEWLILGFKNKENGCVKEFSDHVFVDNRDYASYRFWNIKHLNKE